MPKAPNGMAPKDVTMQVKWNRDKTGLVSFSSFPFMSRDSVLTNYTIVVNIGQSQSMPVAMLAYWLEATAR